MLFAFFHSKETTPSSNDNLNTVGSGTLICSTIYNSNFDGIPYTQVFSIHHILFVAAIFGLQEIVLNSLTQVIVPVCSLLESLVCLPADTLEE